MRHAQHKAPTGTMCIDWLKQSWMPNTGIRTDSRWQLFQSQASHNTTKYRGPLTIGTTNKTGVDIGCVWKCCVSLNPMVLLIIIPIKNGYFIGKINPIFRQTHSVRFGPSYPSFDHGTATPWRIRRHPAFPGAHRAVEGTTGKASQKSCCQGYNITWITCNMVNLRYLSENLIFSWWMYILPLMAKIKIKH